MSHDSSELDETVTIRMSSEMLEKVERQLPSAQTSETIRQLINQALTPQQESITDATEHSNASDQIKLTHDKYIAHLESQIQQKDRQIDELTSQVSRLIDQTE